MRPETPHPAGATSTEAFVPDFSAVDGQRTGARRHALTPHAAGPGEPPCDDLRLSTLERCGYWDFT